VIPQSFNGSNVEGIPANRREDYQPDLTLGGPIRRDRIWFFTAYRRVQTDQTFNNAVVPVQRRGNLWFAKLTTQLIHELQRRGGGRGLVTMCVGGGMGAAGIFEVAA